MVVSAEEFLLLPDDPLVDRELIAGELVERPMTTRSPKHAMALARIGQTLNNWLDDSPEVGVAPVGDVRCRLAGRPDTIVGIDVAYFAGEEAVRASREDPYFDFAPTVAIEVLSASDTHEAVTEKLLRYLEAGVPQVWIVDPDLMTVTIHRSDGEPSFFHRGDILEAEPELPGLRVGTELLFER